MAKKIKKKKSNNKLKIFGFISFAIIFSCVVLISLSGKVDFPFYVPNWQEVSNWLGIKTNVVSGEYNTSVQFIDVGQGDATLIKISGKNILIDGGDNDKGGIVVDYLKKQKVEKIDYMIATHPHADHIGGLDNIINNFKVENIILPKLTDDMVPTTKTYTDLLQAIMNNKINVIQAKPNTSYNVGNGKLTLLAPIGQYTDINNMSVVSKFSIGDVSFLITGDASEQSEKDLIDKNVDLKSTVLRVAHHGSKSSTTKAFLEKVNPSYAIISVGKDNKYGHPDKIVTDLINKNQIETYRTDYNGNIVFYTDGKDIKINTDK